jgi:hypothetical protein
VVFADTFDRIVGIIGAVGGLSGLGAAVFAGLALRRDRPKLVLTVHYVSRREGRAVEVTVLNDGEQAITISAVTIGYSVTWERSRWTAVRRYRVRQWKRATRDVRAIADHNVMGVQVNGRWDGDSSALLEPHAHRVYKFPLASLGLVRSLPHPYVAATDPIGRVVKEAVPTHVLKEVHADSAAGVADAAGAPT